MRKERDAEKEKVRILMDQRHAAYDELDRERAEHQRLRSVVRRDVSLIDALRAERGELSAERDVLRDAMRKLTCFFPLDTTPSDHGVIAGMRKALAPLTPEQRAACGWPDPEPPKPMTWGEAKEAMRNGKTVHRREYPTRTTWHAALGALTGNTIVDACNCAACISLDDFDATDWEICS